MQKQWLRAIYRQERRRIPLSDRLLKSEGIKHLFFSQPQILSCLHRSSTLVHTYLPIARQNEVDTWPIIKQLWRDFSQVRIWSSVTDPIAHTLRHFQLTTETALTENKWGIPEPSGTFTVESGEPDLVIVPLLAFDRVGNRVGYGGGYYDRFLAETTPACLKVGLSFFEPVNQIDDVEETDVRLDGCITPEKAYWFLRKETDI